MPDFVQSLQQKPESTVGARGDFEPGFQELLCSQLDDCGSLASCCSPHSHNGEGDGNDHLVGRRRLSDFVGDDLAESSAARRVHSRILSRWVARQAQEMITTIERKNRESELMALAGLHTVSMLDSSFLRESQSVTSRRQGTVDAPSTQASSIMQMWRGLEDEQMLNRARGIVRERMRHQRGVQSSTTNIANITNTTNTVDSNTTTTTISNNNFSEIRESENQGSVVDHASRSENGYGTWSHEQIVSQNDSSGHHNGSSREDSPDHSEVEREGVRQIARGWMDAGITDHSTFVDQRNSGPREWLGETERERVRIVREWVQMTSQQRAALGGRRDDQVPLLDAHGDQIHERGLPNHINENHPEHMPRDIRRLRGRQNLLDLLVRIERERQGELEGLLQHRAVSEFAHRSRIQSLLRGRFLRNGRPVEDVRPSSVASNELVQLRQRQTVSGLRHGFRSRLENIVRSQVSSSHSDSLSNNDVSDSRHVQPDSGNVQFQESPDIDIEETVENNSSSEESMVWQAPENHGENWDEQVNQERNDNWQMHPFELGEWRDSTSVEDADHNWPENSTIDWNQGMPETENGEGNDLQEISGIWPEDGSGEGLENWSDRDGHSDSPRTGHNFPLRRVNRFHPPEDDNVYSMELRELLNRRSVSNLLHSGFRESLDQLIQSYVERQAHHPIDWNLQRNSSTPSSLGHEHEEAANVENEDPILRPSIILPSPPVPPPQPIWRQDHHHRTNWTRHANHRSNFEWEMMNEVKAEMSKVEQGMRHMERRVQQGISHIERRIQPSMRHMQRMLDACMDMQLELQRSVRQELSAALNRSSLHQETWEDGCKWGLVKKGTCCVCCDGQIDSLLYRCGHMCCCWKCGNELVHGGGKCPLCRAPIVEVIRAYCVS